MHEQPPAVEKEMTKEELLELLKALSERQEGFPFSGLEDDVYAKMEADEKEYPGFATPIVDLMTRFKAHGCKVVLGGDPNGGNAFIVPGDSTDVVMDSVLPGSLKISEDMVPELKKLVLRDKAKMKARHGSK